MSALNTTTAWGSVAKLLHWIVGLLIVEQLISGFLRHWKVIDNPTWNAVYAWLHLPLGFSVLVLAVFRLTWRMAQEHPELPANMTWWERLGANGTHVYLYAIMFAMPLTGWIGFNAINLDVNPFGVMLPRLISDAKPLAFKAAAIHLWLGYGIVLALAFHVVGAAVHHWSRRDDVLTAMLPRFAQGWAMFRRGN